MNCNSSRARGPGTKGVTAQALDNVLQTVFLGQDFLSIQIDTGTLVYRGYRQFINAFGWLDFRLNRMGTQGSRPFYKSL